MSAADLADEVLDLIYRMIPDGNSTSAQILQSNADVELVRRLWKERELSIKALESIAQDDHGDPEAYAARVIASLRSD